MWQWPRRAGRGVRVCESCPTSWAGTRCGFRERAARVARAVWRLARCRDDRDGATRGHRRRHILPARSLSLRVQRRPEQAHVGSVRRRRGTGLPAVARPPRVTSRLRLPGATEPSVPSLAGVPLAPMPSPIQNFAGMSKLDACTGGNCGAVGRRTPTATSDRTITSRRSTLRTRIYNKTGARLAAFTENRSVERRRRDALQRPSQGDPVVLYDGLADRWILTQFAFNTMRWQSGLAVLPMHRRLQDQRPGRWRLVALCGADGSRRRGNASGRRPQRLSQVRPLARLPVHGRQRVRFRRQLSMAWRSRSFSRADLYSGAAADLVARLSAHPAITTSILHADPEQQPRHRRQCRPARHAELFVSESGTVFAFEVRKFTAGPNCGARRHAQRADEREPGVLHLRTFGNDRAAADATRRTRSTTSTTGSCRRCNTARSVAAESLWVTHMRRAERP